MSTKRLIVGGSILGGALLVAVAVIAVVLWGGKPAQGEPPYRASTVSDLLVVQQGTRTYDVAFTVPEDVDAASMQLHKTDSPDYRADGVEDLVFAAEGGRVSLTDVVLAPGDHFLWLVSGDDALPAVVTIPDMAPRVWMDGERPTIQFDESPLSSWSSYVDPEGKAVYASASDSFDDGAEPLATDLSIAETSYRVDDVDPERPFYYLVFTGRDGDSTFVSSPAFASAEQGELTVVLHDGDEPTYVIEGFLAARPSAVDRELALRVGSFNPHNPASTFMVENTATPGAAGDFRFEVPALDLHEGYNDLAVFLTEDGATLEWSLDATGVDLAQRAEAESSIFGLRRVEALQLTRLTLAYESISVDLIGAGDTAHLNVTGQFTEEAANQGYSLIVKDVTGERYEVDNTASGDRFAYSFDMGNLDQSSVWYDVEFGVPGEEDSTPISTISVDDMTQWAKAGTRTYAFADYEGLFKVFFDSSPFAAAHVELTTVGGVPSLVATGDLVDVDRADARLRVRTGDSTMGEVTNTATRAGEFRFVFDLRRLQESGTWYDVVFHQVSTGDLIDFPTSAARDVNQTVQHDYRTYGFHDWEGQLKVAFEAEPAGVNVSRAHLVDDDGTPTLRVIGTLDRADARDVFLRVRSGDQSVDVPNTASAAGRAEFRLDLSDLRYAGEWYDVLIGTRSDGALTDVSATVADLSSSLTLSGRTFTFHEWNDQLKVAFGEAQADLTVTSAVLANVGGTPTLQVAGTVTGADPSAVYLRVRGPGGPHDVANTATRPGQFAFSFNAARLSAADNWYDLLVGVRGTGQLEDVDASVADLSRTLMSQGRTYRFQEWYGDLKIEFGITPLEIEITAAELVDADGVPTLRVTGTTAGASTDDVFVRVRTGAQTIDVPNTGTGSALLAELDLRELTEAGQWYDLLVGARSTGQLTDLRQEHADFSNHLFADGRRYDFHEWAGDLKVAFDETAVAAAITATELVDADGQAVLRATGTLEGTAQDDAFLRIRSGGFEADVPNTATTAGELLFEYELDGLEIAGNWYDVLLGITSTETLTDVRDATADMNQTLARDGREYRFREWGGDLKVEFIEVSAAVTVDSARLVIADGVPVLRVTGAVEGTAPDDAVLRIGSGPGDFDVANAATTEGEALFDFPLTQLTAEGHWYDVRVGLLSTGAFTDVRDAQATMSDTVSLDGRVYSFAEWSGDLKVWFEVVEHPAVQVSRAEVRIADGVPTLSVTGSVIHADAADAFLRVGTGADAVDVPNAATDEGEARFALGLTDLDAGTYALGVGLAPDAVQDLPGSSLNGITRIALEGRTYTVAAGGDGVELVIADTPIAATPALAELVNVAGVPTLRVTGTVAGTPNDDVTLRVRGGGQTVELDNTATASGDLLFTYDLTGLANYATWYDLELEVISTEDVTALPFSLGGTVQTITVDNETYRFRNYQNLLKVERVYGAASVTVTGVEMAAADGVPTLRVHATVAGTTVDDTFVRLRSGSESYSATGTGTIEDAAYEVDLSQMTQSGVWYDVLTGMTSRGTVASIDFGLADMSQSITANDRRFTFHQWGGELKVAWADVSSSLDVSSATLAEVDGVPTLQVSGTASNVVAADVYLRVRSGGAGANVNNTSGDDAVLTFAYDLSNLAVADRWYDVVIGRYSVPGTSDVPESAAAMGQTLAVDGRVYRFESWDGQLKVAYSSTTLGEDERLLIDFGPTDGTWGDPVSGTPYGNHWNSIGTTRPSAVPYSVPRGLSAAGMVTTEGVTTSTSLTLNGTNWRLNGGSTVGGLLNPSETLLGDLAVADATKDYFFVENSGTATLTVGGLDPNRAYTLKFFGTRAAGDTRVTEYTVIGANGQESASLQTTGTGAGTGHNGNNDDLATVSGMRPGALGGANANPTTTAVTAATGAGNVSALTFDDGPNGATTAALLDFLAEENIQAVFCVIGENVATPEGAALLKRMVAEGHVLCNHSTSFADMGSWSAADVRADLAENLRIIRHALGDPSAQVPYFRAPNGSWGVTRDVAVSMGMQPLGVINTINDWWDTDEAVLTASLREAMKPGEIVLVHDGGGDRSAAIAATMTVVRERLADGWTFTLPERHASATVGTIVDGVVPAADGTLQVTVRAAQSSFGYLGFMEIAGGDEQEAPEEPTPPVPAEMARWVAQDALDPVADDSVLFVGSSSIRRWEFLARDYADYDIIQRGWGGSWLSGVNENAPWVVHPYQPAAIVMWAGTNDLSGGTSPAVILQRFQTFVTQTHAASPHTEIAWLTLLPNPNNLHRDEDRRETNRLVTEWAATQDQVHIIDVATPFEDLFASDRPAWEGMFNDTLHLSRAGYEFWDLTVRPGVEAMLAPNKTYTANPNTLADGERLLFDFGPSDGVHGNDTEVDANGHHWNNWYPTTGGSSNLVNTGEHIAGLVDDTGRGTGIGATITGGFRVNGIQTGGLRNPEEALLGDFAIDSVTQDFFFSSASDRIGDDNDLTGSLMLTGLDPAKSYDFEFFGSRADNQTRVTEYTVYGAGSGSAQLTTSGAGIGSTGGNGNNSQVATVTDVTPDAFGQVFIDMQVVQGSFAYLNAMSVRIHGTGPEQPVAPVALGAGERLLVDFGPSDGTNGTATASPSLGNAWNNVAIVGSPSNAVPAGLQVAGLTTTDGTATTTSVTMAGTNWKSNGRNHGGLLAPTQANLQDLAVASATEDYFFVETAAAGTMTITGLDPGLEYDFRFFGTRDAAGTRVTSYTVTGQDGASSANLQTSGAGIGGGGYNGNTTATAAVAGKRPQADGTLQVSVARVQDNFGYLAIMEIVGSEPGGADGPLEPTDSALLTTLAPLAAAAGDALAEHAGEDGAGDGGALDDSAVDEGRALRDDGADGDEATPGADVEPTPSPEPTPQPEPSPASAIVPAAPRETSARRP